MRLFVVLISASFLCAAADTGRLKTEVNPGRAGVFIDGKYIGPAANFKMARTYEVAAGEHEVRLAEPRYQDVVKKVTITAGKRTVLKETMTALPAAKPPFGKLRIENADHFAAVYINEHYMGHVDEFSNFAQGLLLNPGTYEVKIVPATGSPVTQSVTVQADKTVTVK
ncbi:MAG: PEGA domain-containing protein [Bryobacteraceae bacterium]